MSEKIDNFTNITHMMTLTPVQVDKVCTDLQTAVRVEKSSKKIRKIESDFYRSVLEVLRTLRIETDNVVATDIEKYMSLKSRIKQVESDFTVFFQLRFSKLMKLALHEVDPEEWSQLTSEEKDFLKAQQRSLNEYLTRFMDTGQETPPLSEEKIQVPVIDINQPPAENREDDYVLVRIVSDLPTIAQPEGDFYLRNNDIVHLKRDFANMLISRKWAEKMNIVVG
ncbi:MAG: hypothetical protein AAE987_02085 [Thermoplasmataceae archaeon]|jgi:DNA replication initiation complex subunit (GINS family)|nr:hypothetical protein [Candidatus Thermoplasmatota archaeon]